MPASGVIRLLVAVITLLTGAQSFAQVPQPPILLDPNSSGEPQCSDGIDNDGDGEIDFPTDGRPHTGTGDDGCWDPSDDLEAAGLPAGTPTGSSGECSSRTLSLAGNTYNNCDFGAGDLTITAQNITIEKSIIRGSLRPNSSAVADTLKIRDTDIIGGPTNGAALLENTRGQWTLERVRGVRFIWTLYTSGATVRDSAFYDLCGSGSWHMEHVLTSGSAALTIERTWLDANLYKGSSSCSKGGGLSAVIAIYSHSNGGWGNSANKRFIDNRIQIEDPFWPWFHAYAGRTCTELETPTNMAFVGNVWVGPSQMGTPSVTGWYRAATNSWSGNVRGAAATTTRASGAAYPEPPAGGCY